MTIKEQIEAIREKDIRARAEYPEILEVKYRIKDVLIEEFLALADQHELKIYEGYDCGYLYLPLTKETFSSAIQLISVPAKFKTKITTETTFESIIS